MTSPAPIEWIPLEVALAVHEQQIEEHGGLPGVRDRSGLEAALARPRQILAYGEATDLCSLAAAYAAGMARNHSFADGNKRIAFLLAFTFLRVNGRFLDAPEKEAEAMVYRLSSGELTEEAFARWLEDRSVAWPF